MFKDFIPQESLSLVKYSGGQLIDRLGKEIISDVVSSVLCGENIRSLTEGLTQRRVLLMNSALLVTYMKALRSPEDFVNSMNSLLYQEIKNSDSSRKNSDPAHLSQNEKQYLYWFLGLTLKGIDNVARGSEGIKDYLKNLDKNLTDIANIVELQYGKMDMNIKFGKERISMSWPSILRCMLALGAQTLTIRGSEKSMYGKLFEKFVLGSVLTLLGGAYINKNDTSKDRMVFWLSDKDDKRECDATFLLRPGYGLSFDIGFIGKGNTEVSLDKVSRFESRMERGGRRNFMTTIILIDTIGNNSSAIANAHEMGGHIIQMSGTYWVRQLAQIIHEETPQFEHPILGMTDEESLDYIRGEVPYIDLSQFLSFADLEDNI